MQTRLIFVRHAEAEGNMNRQFHGWTDSAITSRGHLQAEVVAQRLKNTPIDIIYSSSLKRTRQTAEYVAELKKLPIHLTDGLKEINGGEWEGCYWDELSEKYPVEYHTWENKPHCHQMPNGESMEQFLKRLSDEVMRIIHANQGKNICIVTHGTAIRALMCFFRGCELEEMLKIEWYDNTSVTIVDFQDGKFKIILSGDASHLGKELSTLQNQEWWDEYMAKFEKQKFEGRQ